MKLAIFGEIIIDVILGKGEAGHKMRLGGVIHAAQAAWALDLDYEVYYFAPSYLETEIQKYLTLHGCSKALRIGNTEQSPGVILIGEPKEIGNQEYSLLMKDTATYSYLPIDFSVDFSDALIFPGGYNLETLLRRIKILPDNIKIHIDIANGIEDLSDLETLRSLDKLFHTIFNSTSHHITDNPSDASSVIKQNCLKEYGQFYLLKENRGGGRLFNNTSNPTSYPAFLRDISHSVGVGDAFNVAYISFQDINTKFALRRASLVSSEYASTSFPDDLRTAIRQLKSRFQSYDTLDGVELPWEDRNKFEIYIAAPDFDWVNTAEIRRLESALRYHNFTPLLPIKLNGQLNDFSDPQLVSETFSKDMELIDRCDLLIAVLINEDPGTLVEIGYAFGIGKTVFIYDPHNSAKNPMVTQMPKIVTQDLGEIINGVFLIARE